MSSIAPGLYKGSVGSGAGCYWERASDFSDEFESVIANNFVPGPTAPIYVEIKRTDVKFETSDSERGPMLAPPTRLGT